MSKTKRISVFKVRRGLSVFFIIFGTLFTVIGFCLFIICLRAGFNYHFPNGDWSTVFFIIQGLLFIMMGYSGLKSRKYFIEWDDNKLRFLLPDTKTIEEISFDEIESANIRLFEIELKLKDKTKVLDLANMQFEDIRAIKEKFEKMHLHH